MSVLFFYIVFFILNATIIVFFQTDATKMVFFLSKGLMQDMFSHIHGIFVLRITCIFKIGGSKVLQLTCFATLVPQKVLGLPVFPQNSQN